MSIASKITNLAACVLVSGIVTSVYVGICLHFAIDCF